MIRTAIVGFLGLFPLAMLHSEKIDVWVGTSNSQASQGIYHTRLNPETGALDSNVTLAAKIRGPGFLAKHPQLDVVYAVGSIDGVDSVAAYRMGGKGPQRSLELIGSHEIGDGGSCHVAVDPTGQMLLTAQYGSGSIATFRLDGDGGIESRTGLIKHVGGSGVVDNRQDSPHAHWVGFSPDNQFAMVPDLGMDQVVIYRVDLNAATVTPHGHLDAIPGGGPRHMKFHPNGKYAYVLNELDLSVTVCDYDAGAGTLVAKQTLETVPKSELAKELFKSASEIRVHPSGKFVYSANRGHDTITAFAVNPDDGTLSVVEVENARATTPRNFNISPSGRWLVTAGQDSFTLAVFAIDAQSGQLTYRRSMAHVPAPICVLFD